MLLRSSIRERRTCRPWYNRPEATIRDVAEDHRATVGCLQDHARCSCSCSGGSRRGFGLWAASTRGVGVAAPFVSLSRTVAALSPGGSPPYVSHTLYYARAHRLIPFRSPPRSCLRSRFSRCALGRLCQYLPCPSGLRPTLAIRKMI